MNAYIFITVIASMQKIYQQKNPTYITVKLICINLLIFQDLHVCSSLHNFYFRSSCEEISLTLADWGGIHLYKNNVGYNFKMCTL